MSQFFFYGMIVYWATAFSPVGGTETATFKNLSASSFLFSIFVYPGIQNSRTLFHLSTAFSLLSYSHIICVLIWHYDIANNAAWLSLQIIICCLIVIHLITTSAREVIAITSARKLLVFLSMDIDSFVF